MMQGAINHSSSSRHRRVGRRKTVTAIEIVLNVVADISVQNERINGWIPSSATNVIMNWPERIKTQPHDDRDNCFLHFDSKGPCGMTVNNDIDDDSATKHCDSHTFPVSGYVSQFLDGVRLLPDRHGSCHDVANDWEKINYLSAWVSSRPRWCTS